MININDPEVEFAVRAVRQAALLVQEIQAVMVTPALTKGDRSPVTVADFAAQALVGRLLASQFPYDCVVAEETSAELREPGGAETLKQVTNFLRAIDADAAPENVCAWIDQGRTDGAQRFWTLDPIDGTKGFLRGDQYAVALALVVDGHVRIGVLGCPNLVDAIQPDLAGPGSLVIAVRGQGAWTTSLRRSGPLARLQVSERTNSAEARLLRSFESGHTNVDQIGEFARAMGILADPVRMDSQAKYAVLAAGGGDLLLRLLSTTQQEYKEKIWDQAAGSLILEEAGGTITDLDGAPLKFTAARSLDHNRGILASNRQLHAAALSALRAVNA